MISVIVPARDAAHVLPDQLGALAAQTYREDWEVIVVDNGSHDDTRECALAAADRVPGLRVIEASDRVGVSHARNVGAQVARGEFLFFCDADDRVEADWLEMMARAMPDTEALGGSLDRTTLNGPDAALPEGAGTSRLIESLPPFLPFASGANCGVRASVLRELGGFDEGYVRGGDDVDFFWRLQLAGYRLDFVPDARIAYRERPTLAGVARQSYDYASQEPSLFRRFRASGMPRNSLLAVARAWGHLIVLAPWYWSSRARRRQWVKSIARRAGRVSGSVRDRVVYL